MKAIVLTAGLAALVACSNTPVARNVYLMRADEPAGTRAVASPATTGIRRVVVAPYLQNPGLVIETVPGEVHGARYHEWAEPLDQGVRRYLRSELSARLGTDVDSNPILAPQWTHAIDLGIDQLHATAAGDAILVAAWRIADPTGVREVSRFRFVQRKPLQNDGYGELAEAEMSLLSDLAEAIANSILAIP
jgi:uncharacterized lipoprotein YmbA